MTAKSSLTAETAVAASGGVYADVVREGARYLAASAIALGVDAGTYLALIRLAGTDYLVAAPIGFLLGLAAIYLLSTRWVFRRRRLSDARVEFAIFASIGVLGLCMNQFVIYAGVERLALSHEIAKLASVGLVFAFNFISRKLLLFTRFA
jgi:putative flippase GtrA